MKLIVSLFLITALSFQCISGFAYDKSNKNQGTVYVNSKVDTSIPKWFKPMNTTNLNDRLNVFPSYLQKYKSSDQFLVIPSMGLITPINELGPSNPDYKSALQGNFDYNKYLVSGPTIYPGTASVGAPGNTFIFAHSNYRFNEPGDFKTIFRLIYNVQKDDTILYYKKINWKRSLFTYSVTKSFLVNATDVAVMLPQKGKKELTLSACRPIGTAKQRWINRALLVSQEEIDYPVDQQITKKTLTSNTNITYISRTNNNVPYSPQLPKPDPNSIKAANLALIVVKMHK